MPLKAPIPYASWTGGYIGANIGVARMDATCANTDAGYGYYGACSSYYGAGGATASDTSFIGGVQAGYDWQMRSLVLGVVADWDWTNLSHTTSGSDVGYYGPFKASTDWLASARGRAGLVVEDTMVYVTGGVAVGSISASSGYDYGATIYSSIHQDKVGWVAGGGLEHKFGQHWSAFAEALYYDLGNTTGSLSVVSSEPYQSEFNFSFVTARAGVNFRW
jgi:outer membrane immunogenic protein